MHPLARASLVLALTVPACSPAFAGASDPRGPSIVPGALALPMRALGLPVDRRGIAERRWSQLAQLDGAACRAELRAQGTRFRALPDRASLDARGCGIAHGVVVTRGPTGIVYDAPLVLDCSIARTLPDVERVIQDEARATLGSSIRRIGTLGTFACRPVRGGWSGLMSEHAFGTAMDLARFTPSRGRAVTVGGDYPHPDTPRGRFVHGVYARLGEVPGIGHVLGPEYNAEHRDHFHVDAGRHVWGWF